MNLMIQDRGDRKTDILDPLSALLVGMLLIFVAQNTAHSRDVRRHFIALAIFKRTPLLLIPILALVISESRACSPKC